MTDLFVVSDFNADLLARFAAADRSDPPCRAEAAPFGQVFQTLAAFDAPATTLAVWTRPEGISGEWARHLAGEPVTRDAAMAEVDAFAQMLVQAAGRARSLFVATWVPSRIGRGLGMLEWTADGGARLLAEMNLRLADALAAVPGAYLLDTQRWIDAARPARDSKFWHAIKSPFSEAVFKAAATDIKAAMRARSGKARKLLLLDLDDTMWGGVVGDDGADKLRLGGHDAIGEAHADFQRAALALSKRGIALGIVSKNDEDVALAAIDSHPGMLVRRADLAGWRINWNDKAQNIVALTAALNLGLDSVVFIDDNPVERGRVREALPQVLVPEMPNHVSGYADVLRQLDCFDQAGLTAEDRARTDMYVAERSRRDAAVSFTSAADFLKSLDIEVEIAPFGPENAKRVVQLLNKTNQLNLATRRLTDRELEEWLATGTARALHTVSVKDRFGDLGLTGIVSWEVAGNDLEIVDFILSCRAMGREVERTMAALAVAAAKQGGQARTLARYVTTARNRPTLDFWTASGFEAGADGLFVHLTDDPYPFPEVVRLSEGGTA
jgi:FkbH-like protein